MGEGEKPLVWLEGEIRSPPFSDGARLEAGYLLGKLQQGEKLSMPQSRPMPQIGRRCHELRIRDKQAIWRIIYRIDSDAIIILDVFAKKSRETPKHIVKACKGRLRRYDSIAQGD